MFLENAEKDLAAPFNNTTIEICLKIGPPRENQLSNNKREILTNI
jgi:hypothetical protein